MATTYLHLPSNPRSQAKKWNFPLGIEGFRFADLNRVRRLAALNVTFIKHLQERDPDLGRTFEAWQRSQAQGYSDLENSDMLLRVAPYVGDFIATIFHIEHEYGDMKKRIQDDNVIFLLKHRYLDRYVLKSMPCREELDDMDLTQLEFEYREIVNDVLPTHVFADDPERELAEVATQILERTDKAKKAKDAAAERYLMKQLAAVQAWTRALAFHPAFRDRAGAFPSFKTPDTLDYQELVERRRPDPDLPELFCGLEETRRYRDGFLLTDNRWSSRETCREAHYCLICHLRGKDYCCRGYPDKQHKTMRTNPLGIALHGCPLDEKISEAHALKREGELIGALAVIMIDNPMCAGTGHRICNDCMKACIFQKQEPVNIPQIETGILTEVLSLPYGFEILSLLTRWNPLNAARPSPLPYNGRNVLVVGMGPAGYTLAHYLLNEGFGVVGIDGLKIEPLSIQLRGSKRRVPQPIRDIETIKAPLDERTILGFGGVSEYGITVRWDKNFLDINYLLLMRRKKFRLFDGVRFGGTLNIEDAWDLGFDHIAIATGAGKPTVIPMKHNLVRGVRKASDFLMGLQATGTYKKNALGNLQVELPAVVIGGGLTAIDTATELQAYYVTQVEKVLDRYERLATRIGKVAIWMKLDAEEEETLRTWLRHAHAVCAERAAAKAAGRPPDFARLVHSWGGVKIVYRKRLQDSPAYRLNHEEVIKSLEEGVEFVECMSPVECIADEGGKLKEVVFERCKPDDKGKLQPTGEMVRFPARSLVVAAGTHPNTTYAREYPGALRMDGDNDYFQVHKIIKRDGGHRLVHASPGEPGACFTSYENRGRHITFFGDNHPYYAGNVVKAMASAKLGYPEIAKLFETGERTAEEQSEFEKDWVRFANSLDHVLRARVVDAFRLTKNIVEVVVHAPMAAKKFKAGQFFRLQNYDAYAEEVEGFKLTMEGIALTGAWCSEKEGLISLIVLEMGGSSRLCALLEPGEEVVLMGPTGVPTEIPEKQTVMLVGGGLGNAVHLSIAMACKRKHNRVIYFAGYKEKGDLFKRREIEAATDIVVWSVNAGDLIEVRRPQDRTMKGNVVEAIGAYSEGKLGDNAVKLSDVDRMIVIGSDRMMRAVQNARQTMFQDVFKRSMVGIGSINTPMQCMMKAICAQCLQRHENPATGEESFLFSCACQDQLLEHVDFEHLHQRLRQNSTAEKLTSLWIDYLFEHRQVQTI